MDSHMSEGWQISQAIHDARNAVKSQINKVFLICECYEGKEVPLEFRFDIAEAMTRRDELNRLNTDRTMYYDVMTVNRNHEGLPNV